MNPTLYAIQNNLGSVLVATLNSLIPACLLAVAVWAMFRLFPNVSAAVRYGSWWAVLIAVVAMPFTPRVFNFQYRFVNEISTPQIRPIEAERTSRPVAAHPSSVASTVVPIFGESLPVSSVVVGRMLTRGGSGGDRSPQPTLLDKLRNARVTLPAGNWGLWIGGIWLAAALWRLARIARSYAYLRGVLSNSEAASAQAHARLAYWTTARKIRRRARLLISNEATGPMAFGVLRPTIVLPASLLQELAVEELDNVLLHELAHIARGDNWTNLFARLIGVVAGLHPIAAYALHQIEQNRELACDDWVVSTTGEPHSYAAALARVFELCHPSISSVELATGMANHPSQSHLGARIGYLLKRDRSFTSRVPRKVWAMQIVALASLVLLGAQSPHWVALAQVSTTAPQAKSAAAPIGDHLPVDKLAFAPPGLISKYLIPYTEAKRDDIIVFRYPTDFAQSFIASSARKRTSTTGRVAQLQTQTIVQILPQLPVSIPKSPELLIAEHDVTQISEQLAILRQSFKEAHPRVINARALLAEATAKRDALAQDYEHARGVAESAASPEQLQRDLSVAQSNMHFLEAALAQLETEHRLLLTRYSPEQESFKDLEQKIAKLRTEKDAVAQRLGRLQQNKSQQAESLGQVSQKQRAAEQKLGVATNTAALLARQLEVEQKNTGMPDTGRIIELQKQLLTAHEVEIVAWGEYAEQLRDRTTSPKQ